MIFKSVLGSILMMFDRNGWQAFDNFGLNWKTRFLFRSESQKLVVYKIRITSELFGLDIGLFQIHERLFRIGRQFMESGNLHFSLHTIRSTSIRVFLSTVIHGFRTQLNMINNSNSSPRYRKNLI